MPIIRLPKKKARPNGHATSRGLINGSNQRLHDGSRKSGSDTDICKKKAALTLEKICPKIKLTDRECGQNGCQCAVPGCGEEIEAPINPSPRYDGGKAMTAIGKEARSPLAKGKPTKGDKRRRSVETRKIRTDKRIKMVILQTEW